MNLREIKKKSGRPQSKALGKRSAAQCIIKNIKEGLKDRNQYSPMKYLIKIVRNGTIFK